MTTALPAQELLPALEKLACRIHVAGTSGFPISNAPVHLKQPRLETTATTNANGDLTAQLVPGPLQASVSGFSPAQTTLADCTSLIMIGLRPGLTHGEADSITINLILPKGRARTGTRYLRGTLVISGHSDVVEVPPTNQVVFRGPFQAGLYSFALFDQDGIIGHAAANIRSPGGEISIKIESASKSGG